MKTERQDGRPSGCGAGAGTRGRILVSVAVFLTLVAHGCGGRTVFSGLDTSASACHEKECGVWDGQDCGSCGGPTDFCNRFGQCEDACWDRECGFGRNSVFCGDCPLDLVCRQSGRCAPSCPPDPHPSPCPDGFGPEGEICIHGQARWVMDYETTCDMVEGPLVYPGATSDATMAVVKVYDLLAYADDPGDIQPLGMAEVNPQDGSFRILGVMVPDQGLLALLVDDMDEQSDNRFVPMFAPCSATPYQHIENVPVYGATYEQVDLWTEAIGGDAFLEQLGCPSPRVGERTLLTCGTWIGVYFWSVVDECDEVELGLVEGVVPEDPAGDLRLGRVFYPGLDGCHMVFNAAEPGVVWSNGGPNEYTGIYGTVLFPYAPLATMSGHCASSTQCADVGCLWSPILGGSLPGTFFVQSMAPVQCTGFR